MEGFDRRNATTKVNATYLQKVMGVRSGVWHYLAEWHIAYHYRVSDTRRFMTLRQRLGVAHNPTRDDKLAGVLLVPYRPTD